MMEIYRDEEPFSIKIHENGIASIEPNDPNSEDSIGYLNQAFLFVEQISELLKQEKVKAVMYHSLFPHARFRYKRLFEDEKRHIDYEEKLQKLLLKVAQLQQQPKPLIAYVDYFSTGINLSIHLWAHYKIIENGMFIKFPESKYGLFPGFGAIGSTLSCMSLTDAYEFLTQGNHLEANDAVTKGLFTAVVSNSSSAITIAEQLLQQHQPKAISPPYTSEDLQLFHTLAHKTNKKTRGLLAGTSACLKIMESTLQQTDREELIHKEASLYQEVISNPCSKAMVRTGYYHKVDSRRFAFVLGFESKRIGIIGAGMMGAGIAYEAAKSGMEVILKDSTLAQAERGKSYSDRIATKLVERGQLTVAKKNALLARIKPVDDYKEFHNLDTIIEAVFEDMELKKEVIQEASQGLKKDGLMASNTTSLPISELAQASNHKADFIGMHFFSPVDRMQLVEIVEGKDSSEYTVAKATLVANSLQKTPIFVKDGPGFFTSRVFFNYLLEAITMLLEGIPAKDIEQEAWKAGFGVGPLAVLDEISLPLMLHVYDQLPSLSPSQQRAYTYLNSLITNGRSGRKTSQGFYNYGENKELWHDPALPSKDPSAEMDTISRRLLHVMALDSYRCLDEGILTDPSDGDLGSTLGIGFPVYTGGVFSYLDQVGLAQFVQDCESFSDKGEQWEIPASLVKLAEKKFTFYKGFKSNWS